MQGQFRLQLNSAFFLLQQNCPKADGMYYALSHKMQFKNEKIAFNNLILAYLMHHQQTCVTVNPVMLFED